MTCFSRWFDAFENAEVNDDPRNGQTKQQLPVIEWAKIVQTIWFA